MNTYQMRLLGGDWYLCLATGEPIIQLEVDTLTPRQTAVLHLTTAGIINPNVEVIAE